MSDRELEHMISTIVTVLSLCGSLFIVVCYVALSKLRSWNMTLVVVLSVLDILSDVGGLLMFQIDPQPDPGRPVCVATAVYVTLFDLPPVLWTSVISFSLYLSIIKRRPVRTMPNHLKFHLGVVALVSAVFAAAAAIWGAYGEVESQQTCWLEPVSARIALFYAPLWLVIGFNVAVNVLVTREYNLVVSKQHALSRAASHGRIHRLKLYPLALVAVWGWGSVLRIMELQGREEGLGWMNVLHSGFRQSQGLVNALVYGLDPLIRSELHSLCQGRCHGMPLSPTDRAELERMDRGPEVVTPAHVLDTSVPSIPAGPGSVDSLAARGLQPSASGGVGSYDQAGGRNATPVDPTLRSPGASPPLSPSRRRRRKASKGRRGADELLMRERAHAHTSLAEIPEGGMAGERGGRGTPDHTPRALSPHARAMLHANDETQALSPEGPERLISAAQLHVHRGSPRSPSFNRDDDDGSEDPISPSRQFGGAPSRSDPSRLRGDGDEGYVDVLLEG
eukprot:TRINITY_DN13647_c0_g1_i2.p1 TRINITY_DN13647_c0_g1~~TRINITY_DN13647_c0_g1_i2.p1  ORF type:complete len:530 (+),score=135.21 TRINITY_DN13647_c0_g1_i2:73-1590(+)